MTSVCTTSRILIRMKFVESYLTSHAMPGGNCLASLSSVARQALDISIPFALLR